MPEPTVSGATQADASVTPPAQAATITSPDAQEADGNSEPLTHEEARKLRSEAQNLRKREKDVLAQLKVYQDAEQQAKDAQLPEIERLKKQAADLQAQHEELAAELYEARVFQDVSRLSGKFNFLVSAETLARMLLLDDDAIEFTDGKPTNIEKLLEKLAKSEPGLVKPAEQQQQQRGAPALPGMNPGRSSIQRPDTTGQGKRPSWDSVPWKT